MPKQLRRVSMDNAMKRPIGEDRHFVSSDKPGEHRVFEHGNQDQAQKQLAHI